MKKRGNLVWDPLIPWIIGIGVLALGVMIYFILTGKMSSAADFLKNLLKFGK